MEQLSAPFDFQPRTRLIFGVNAVERVGEIIRELGLELTLSFNKGAVMILPSGVNKASGLHSVLKELET